MILSPWLIGGLVGLAVGVMNFLILSKMMNSKVKEGRIERGQPGYVLDLVRKLDLVMLPIIGALVGRFVFGGSQ